MIFSNDSKARLNSFLYIEFSHFVTVTQTCFPMSWSSWQYYVAAVSGNCWKREFAHLGCCCCLPFIPYRVSHRSVCVILFSSWHAWLRLAVERK